jgi:hypothetical protein
MHVPVSMLDDPQTRALQHRKLHLAALILGTLDNPPPCGVHQSAAIVAPAGPIFGSLDDMPCEHEHWSASKLHLAALIFGALIKRPVSMCL